MRGPALHGKQEMTFVLEGPLRRLTGRIREKVRVARRISEVVEAVALEHPGSLEEAAIMVATKQRFAVFAQYEHVARRFGKVLHVGSQPCELRHQRGFVILVSICGRPGNETSAGPVLELPSPDPAEIHIALAIRVCEDRRINAKAALDRFGLSLEGPQGIARRRDSDAEHSLLVAGRKIKVVGSITVCRVGRPHLLGCPGHVLYVERYRTYPNRAADTVHFEHPIIM